MNETKIKDRDRNYYVLAAIYFAIFFAATFVNIKSTQFMGVDEGSISEAIYGLFKHPYYNMMAWYHSRYYGWTFMAITAFALIPFKLIFHVNNPEVTNYVIRLVLFLIGLSSVLVLYRLSVLVTTKKLISIAIAIVFMLSPAVANHLYTIHPESTGILFFLLGSLFFLRFLENKVLKNYLFCLVFLVLSSLAKQAFFIMSMPLLLYILLDYCNWNYVKLFRFVSSSRFWKILIGTIAISLGIAFVINPAAFLQFKEFVAVQTSIARHFQANMPLNVSMGIWFGIALNQPIVVAHTVLFMVVLCLFFIRKGIPRLFVFSVVTSTAIMLLFMYTARDMQGARYLAVLYPVFLINISCALISLYKKLGDSKPRLVGTIAITFLVGWGGAQGAAHTANVIFYNVMLHKQSLKYASWNYIESLPKGTKIVFDPNVALPDDRLSDACHIWQGCGVMGFLEKFQPDYFILYKDYQYTKWEVIDTYINTHNFCVIGELSPTMQDDFNPEGGVSQLVRTFEHNKNHDILGNKLTIWAKCQEGKL